MKFWNPCYRSENKKSSLLLRLCFYNFQQLNSYTSVIVADASTAEPDDGTWSISLTAAQAQALALMRLLHPLLHQGQ
jgi:hypothetical protein